MNYLYLDIETIPCQNEDMHKELVANVKPPANYKNPEAIENWRKEKAKEIIAKTSFDGALGHVCQISCFWDEKHFSSTVEEINSETNTMLEFVEFLNFTNSHGNFVPPVVSGHNVNGFDIPFLWKRAVCLGVKLPAWFPKNPKPWSEETFDTMYRWDSKNLTSMDRLAKALGIQGKQDMDGSMVADEWKSGNFNKIAEYCMDDVLTVKSIHERMMQAGM